MASKVIRRLPEVKTLYDILPKGVEGGKEFARIVDLLLFHDARRIGKKFSTFSDVAGDYYGLDSFGGDAFRKEGTTGYQYKFHPSPLSAEHRKNIIESLKRSIKNQKKVKLNKWILITPQDLIESSVRRDGGDVTWFENLRNELGLKFELEHWGHKKLLAMFLETPSLCLFYYPELIDSGNTRKKTIEDTCKRYYDNLIKLYREIQFVGMSIYKQEATKGIPMEHIYIPLTVIPEAADELYRNVQRINPLSFLTQSTKSVILGDPGSGKSTLLRFLALAGISRALQGRYKANADKRLPIYIILRHYADELKSRQNLSIIDYIQESIRGHFNLNSADLDFFEYYLETGQTILLFDGLDELPNPHFKQIVRDRIHTLITTYPGNTTLVTSRIVGYENPFRFDENEFKHYRLTELRLPEIEQFVNDWYRVRIENQQEREANVKDLIRILRDESHVAIRELAENPLLLTIVALVHRIDAVLPDERVVLYQKCTETLLNTWHTWKFRGEEVKNRGKVERRNRLRMEAIAHWMHCRSVSTGKNQRAVVPYAGLCEFLTKHIAEIEKSHDPDNEPEDLAKEFLEFVKKRAGLLIEVGDNQYSFVHLTFQEYLTASYIITTCEMEGVSGIWKKIKDYCKDSRWHEVIRLLIAGLKSDNSQRFLIEQILPEIEKGLHMTKSLLLGGLLIDGIEPAEKRMEEILKILIFSGCKVVVAEQLRPIISMLRTWISKDKNKENTLWSIFQTLKKTADDNKLALALSLIASSMNWSETKNVELKNYFPRKSADSTLFKFFLSSTPDYENSLNVMKKIDTFWTIQNVFMLTSPYWNFVAAVGEAITSSLDLNVSAKRSFEEQMISLSVGFSGPYNEFTFNSLIITCGNQSQICIDKLTNFLSYKRDRHLKPFQPLDQDLDKNRGSVLDMARNLALSLNIEQNFVWARKLARARARSLGLDSESTWAQTFTPKRKLDEFRDRELENIRTRTLVQYWDNVRTTTHKQSISDDFWQAILATPGLYNPIIDYLCDIFALKPRTQWWEALRFNFLPHIPQRITIYNETTWRKVENAFATGKAGETEVYNAAWQILFDSWLYIFGYYKSPNESIFSNLVQLTDAIDAAPLRIAHCIRDLAYGDASRTDDLISMVKSNDPEYRKIFETCFWRLTPEEEMKIGKKREKDLK